MIVYPNDWRSVGQEVALKDIEDTLIDILSRICSNSLSLSGGVDSSLLLHYMAGIHPTVYAYTIGKSLNHPDVEYAKLATSQYHNIKHVVYIPTEREIANEIVRTDDFEGDTGVRLFYRHVYNHTSSIVTGDGVDEFMAGYYTHQRSPTEETYYGHLRRLRSEQLTPLDRNSGGVRVYLPYIDSRMVSLMSQIPLSEKVDENSRKKVIQALARGKVPDDIIERRKYGFVSALWDMDRLVGKKTPTAALAQQ